MWWLRSEIGFETVPNRLQRPHALLPSPNRYSHGFSIRFRRLVGSVVLNSSCNRVSHTPVSLTFENTTIDISQVWMLRVQ